MNPKRSLWIILASLFFLASLAKAEDRSVRVYNWVDYIGETTLSDFQKSTGIKPIYDVFDSNETLEGKLLAGHTGYDLVFPSNHFAERLIKAKVFEKLDRSKIPNWKNIDPVVLKQLEANDPGNLYTVPYMWGTTGIAYNKEKIKQVLGVDHIDSWSALFDPEVIKKLSKCGVAVMDSPDELFPAVLAYQHKNPQSFDIKDYESALEVLKLVRPYITYFHSSKYISDLANGNICVAMSYSGDSLQARDRAVDAKNGIEIEYAVPKEGSNIWFDVIAIPADAKNVDEAHAFINFLLAPENIAKVSSYINFANGVPASKKYLPESIVNNSTIYPPQEVIQRLYVSLDVPPKVMRWSTRAWSGLKSGN